MSQKRDRRRIRRNETNDLDVCTEWVQKWISPNRIRKNKDLSVREIVRGPFSSPKLLRIQPIIEIPSSQQQAIIVNENCNDLRYGIPDTWKEYLIRKGFCNPMEACVSQCNLIPFFVRSFVTDKLWNELGLPLVQGIPDPWKFKSFSERRSVKCLRQQCVYNDSTSSQITCIYDGDDEAEIEHGLKTQFNEDHVDNKKDPFQEKNKDKKTIQLQVDQNPKLTSEHKKHKEHEHKKQKEHEHKKHKEPTQKCNDDVQKDTEKIISKTRAINTKRKKKKCNKMIQTKEKVPTKKSLVQKHKAKTDDVKNETKNHIKENTQKHFNTICCNYKDFSEQTTQVEETGVSNLVLCPNCENYHHDSNLHLNSIAETMDCVPKTNNGSQHKTIDKKKMNKPCSCLKQIKERFTEKNHTASEQEMRFVCGQCNNPYLKIAAVKNTTGQRTNFYNLETKEQKKIMICISQCPMTRNQSKNIVPSSENHCCTFTETKTNISKGDFDQVRRRHSCNNNPSEKNVSGVKFDENAEIGTANAIRTNFQNDIKAENVTQTHEKKIITKTVTADKLHKEKELEDDSSNGKRKMKKKGCRCNNDTMIDDEKCRVKQFQQVRFATTLRYSVSDSGEYADVSDNYIDDGEVQDRLSVTSITFIQRLEHNSNKKSPIEGCN